MAVESVGEPERGWRGLNAALRHYGIWPAMGPLPRGGVFAGKTCRVSFSSDLNRSRSGATAPLRRDSMLRECRHKSKHRAAR
ncbi:hypothetical protein PG997_000885 [Apiospora hydei]|uniref:Transposase n=1 Tax=Apiospora hydei TaxID=1337664 RepID=A0ABR1XC28_9PEZI